MAGKPPRSIAAAKSSADDWGFFQRAHSFECGDCGQLIEIPLSDDKLIGMNDLDTQRVHQVRREVTYVGRDDIGSWLAGTMVSGGPIAQLVRAEDS